MGNELHGDGPTGARVRMFPAYWTALGEALFPGADFHSLQLRADFSEMLVRHLEDGGDLELAALRASLATFRPWRMSTATHPTWADRETEEWQQLVRPRIIATMGAFFLGGGRVRRLEEQRAFFTALQAAGIRFGDRVQLVDRVAHAGNWRDAFVRIAVMGRNHGIQLVSDGLDRRGIASAMHRTGFSQDQQREIWSNIRGTARRPAAWKRLLQLVRRLKLH